jgi:Flp pilus assembly secretin CpaC
MRLRVVLAVAALALALAPAAHAASLPDLPGMGPAAKAIGQHAQTADSTTAAPVRTTGSAPSGVASASGASTAPAAGVNAQLVKPITSLPGGGAIPVIGALRGATAASRGVVPGPDALVVIAALGSFAALTALYMLRRLNRV